MHEWMNIYDVCMQIAILYYLCGLFYCYFKHGKLYLGVLAYDILPPLICVTIEQNTNIEKSNDCMVYLLK